ncbi:olfactory receptor 52N2-like [Hyperolius riggenbachi]|uniref:olfactory receptor 52N2-like n=1 Tax=Hyperolius riggenbachi TaxID=752182 RepID=UPI0035A26E4C
MSSDTWSPMEDLAINTSFSHTEFILRGFPGISQSRQILAIPLLFMYTIILISNGVILHIICMEKTLHLPMYILIMLLLAGNIVYSMAIVPKFLLALVFELDQITLTGCLTQMLFMYFTGTFESNALLLMAIDRYIAIMIPLHYHHIMSSRTLTMLVLVGYLRSLLLSSVIVGFASKVQFCRSNVILNFACENMSLLSLGCGDLSRVHTVGLWVRILFTGFDGTIILVSYVRILHTIRKLVEGKSREKSWQTCSAHMQATTVTYVCGFSASVAYRIGSVISTDVQNSVNLINYVIPTASDPFIYGLKMREIRKTLKRTLRQRSS